MEKTITVKREYKYLIYLIICSLLVILFTEGSFIYYDDLKKEIPNWENFYRLGNEIENKFKMGVSLYFLFLAVASFLWSKKFDYLSKLMALVGLVCMTLFALIVFEGIEIDFYDQNRWLIRLLHIGLCLPFIVMFYYRTIIGDTVLEREYKKKEIESGYSTYQDKLKYALENNVITQEEYNLKISQQKKNFMENVVLIDKEYVSYKQKLDDALSDNIISKEEHERKLKDFKEKRLEDLKNG